MRCVYTVLLGGYESLTEQPVAHTSAIDFICLTDNPNLTSDTWTIEVVTPLIPEDSIRSQRHLKITGHPVLKKYSETLYIDNSVLLKHVPEELFEKYGGRASLALPLHSFRATVDDEFCEVSANNLDDPKVFAKQHARYRELAPQVLGQKPYWTGIMIRDHSQAELKPLMDMWWSEVAAYSRRDQLSINACLAFSSVNPFTYQIDNYESCFHRWPVAKGKREDMRHWGGVAPALPSLAVRGVGRALVLTKRFKVSRQK